MGSKGVTPKSPACMLPEASVMFASLTAIPLVDTCRIKAEGDQKCRLKVEYQLVYVTSVNAFIKKAIERGMICVLLLLYVL